MNTKSRQLRAFRYLSERYYLRERPNFFAELSVFAVIIVVIVWPMLLTVQAMAAMPLK